MNPIRVTLLRRGTAVYVYPKRVEYLLYLPESHCSIALTHNTVDVQEDMDTVERMISEALWRDARDTAAAGKREGR